MASPIYQARKKIEKEQELARDKAYEQLHSLRGGYSRTDFTSVPPSPGSAVPKRPQGYKPGPAQTVDQLGGAQDNPDIEITVGPDGQVIRRRRK